MTKIYELQGEIMDLTMRYFREKNTEALTKVTDSFQAMLIQMRSNQ